MMRFLAILALTVAVAAAMLTEVGRTLLCGWIGFAVERFPQARANPAAVATGAVVVALFAALVDLFARWCCRGGLDASGEPRPRWRFRWTFSVLAGVFLMFAAGYSTIGLARHVGWLVTSQEPLRGKSLGGYYAGLPADANVRFVSLGLATYQDVHHQWPASGTFDESGQGLHSWETQILPYMNYDAPEIKMALPWDHPENADPFRHVVPEFINPGFRTVELRDARGFGLSHYAANSRVLGPNHAMAAKEVTDGLANTILAGEVNHAFRPWGDPVNARDPAAGINRRDGFGGPPGARGAQFILADGSVRFVSEDVDPAVLRSLATPADGDKAE